ncbi:MAG: hypothetical protein HRT52_11680 [Colwellia sp.]|nr:hypothetical protein [Colwellia sp.]NQZ81666.1 hypothetical protein [Colwellia sp.]
MKKLKPSIISPINSLLDDPVISTLRDEKIDDGMHIRLTRVQNINGEYAYIRVSNKRYLLVNQKTGLYLSNIPDDLSGLDIKDYLQENTEANDFLPLDAVHNYDPVYQELVGIYS